ncbi:MAG: DUF465 domain-containing protein [Rhodobacteraceae bacterium]|nr:DUF465 domain-containing protein [Paracoccaceae bacterium]
MSSLDHLDKLKEEHAELSRMVEEEQQKLSADFLYISELKKRKLLLKEQIAGLK